MRRVGRLALRERAIERRPPPPAWRARALKIGAAVLALGAVAGGGAVLTSRVDTAWLAMPAGLELPSALGGVGPVIGEVLVEGRARTSAESLAYALDPFIGRRFVALDTEEVRLRVERLPWVRAAQVVKLLPDTLHVRLHEHAAVALWHDGTRTALIGADGAVLEVEDLRPFKELKLLHGEGAPQATAGLLELLEAQPELARRITAAGRVGQRRWNLYLDGRIEVRLPEEAAAAALERLARLERDGGLLGRAVRTIDLRNPGWTSIGVDGGPAQLLVGRGE